MPTFDDYQAFEDDNEHLDLPINGTTYRINPMGIRDGALIERYRAGDKKALDSLTYDDIMHMTLGAAYDQMLADNVPRTAVGRAHMTAMAFNEGGVEMARQVWDRSIDPELGAALRAATQGKTVDLTGSTPSKRTGAASRTPSPASGRTTSSRKATKRAAASKRGRAT